ncbi:MAG: ABC-F type ribosomal protection protein [Vagococcus sp.]|uniref:ribosomal protection-like ABC-F family protein n=1 Tax=Vagococcus sp. TaxID=1933889 RepID=UPI002FC95433
MLQLNQVNKTMFGKKLLEDVSIQINDGEKMALIGDNGAGKSTLLKMITGDETIDSGSVSISKDQKISYLEQQSLVKTSETVFDFIYNGQKEIKELFVKMTSLETDMMTASSDMLEKLMTQYGLLQEKFLEKDGYSVEESIKSIATGLKISHLLDQSIGDLSGGEQTLAKLARCLLENNDILLLDEPTNHLDSVGLNWLENHLRHSKQTVIIVSHDRYFLDQVVTSVLFINQRKIARYKGNYTAYKKQREQEILEQQKNFLLQQKEIKQVEDAIRRFRHWGAISDDEKHFKKAKRLENQLETMEKIDQPKKAKRISEKQGFLEEKRSGKEVLKVENVSKTYDGVEIFSDVSFSVWWQERLAILGDNGSGKSTLLKCVLGKEVADSGKITMGPSVKIGYLSQVITYERPKQTVLEYFRNDVDEMEEDARRILSYFYFNQDNVFKQVGNLSGGEKVRLELACLMNQPINCLILDEPTNHLDILTREWLEEQLEMFKGTLIMISHDRYFVEKLSTKHYQLKNNRKK